MQRRLLRSNLNIQILKTSHFFESFSRHVISSHFHVIFVSFLSHIHVIFESFLSHFYVISMSFLCHIWVISGLWYDGVYKLLGKEEKDERDERDERDRLFCNRAMEWCVMMAVSIEGIEATLTTRRRGSTRPASWRPSSIFTAEGSSTAIWNRRISSSTRTATSSSSISVSPKNYRCSISHFVTSKQSHVLPPQSFRSFFEEIHVSFFLLILSNDPLFDDPFFNSQNDVPRSLKKSFTITTLL